MLKSLSISNYALIENIHIDFPDGLVIITGETGAGKSILLGALSLALGAKADLNILRDQAKNCVVEAIFDISSLDAIKELLIQEDIEANYNELVLRRVISPGGKSRTFLDDNPVSINFLKSFSENIIDIHSQHQHLLLGDSNFQLSVLDAYCNNGDLLQRYTNYNSQYQKLSTEYRFLKNKIEDIDKSAEFNRFQLEQLQSAKLKIGELEELEGELSVLTNAEDIKSSIHQAINLLESEQFSIAINLKESGSLLNKISAKFPQTKELSERVESARVEIKEIERDLSNLIEHVNYSPEKIVQIEERVYKIYDLLRKHNVKSVDELIDIEHTLQRGFANSEVFLEELEKLGNQIEILAKEREKFSEELNRIRREKSDEFAQVILNDIIGLEMPHSRFSVIVEDTQQYGPRGRNDVKFIFSANKNIAERELGKIASGGEMSRIMLCLKSVMAKKIGMPTMIFDEIDTGVSGSIADKMGNLIYELSKNIQIFAISHLPQIASKGSTHLLVYKTINEETPKIKIKTIGQEERVNEIARMLSGSELTPAAIENAKVLLRANNN